MLFIIILAEIVKYFDFESALLKKGGPIVSSVACKGRMAWSGRSTQNKSNCTGFESWTTTHPLFNATSWSRSMYHSLFDIYIGKIIGLARVYLTLYDA